MTLEEIITTRRSVRSYTDKPVSKETVLKLLDMARWAPYASECWRFVAVTEDDGKALLAKAARQDFIATAPVIIVVGADTEVFAEKGSVWHRWDAYKWRGLFYIQDTAAAIQNLMLMAAEMGLGTCWIGSFNEGDVSKAVGFPAAVRPVAMIPVGHPAKPQKKSERAPLENFVSWEKYAAAAK
ncbi:MAG: nitroreductase family protein [Planctomycetota bacterium]|nr:nitroreductase family protein [Planctomycetota bacterium]